MTPQTVSSRTLAREIGVSGPLVTRKRGQGKDDDQIREEAAIRKAGPQPKTPRAKYSESQARKEWHLANLRELEELEKRGELVNAVEVRQKWTESGIKIRDAVMGLKTRVGQRVPAEWRREVMAAVEAEARNLLKVLHDDIHGSADSQ